MFPEVNVYNISGIHRMGIVLLNYSLRCKSYAFFVLFFPFRERHGTRRRSEKTEKGTATVVIRCLEAWKPRIKMNGALARDH